MRDGATGDGDEEGLLRADERLAIAALPFVGEHSVHPALGEARPHVDDGIAADVEGAAHLGQTPARAQLARDLGARTGTRAGMARVDEGLHARAEPKNLRPLSSLFWT